MYIEINCLYNEIYFLNFLSTGEQVDMGWGQKMFIKCLGEGLPTGNIILD